MNKNYTSYQDYCGIEFIPRLLGDKELQLCAMQGQVFTMAINMEIPINGFAEIFMQSSQPESGRMRSSLYDPYWLEKHLFVR